MKSEYYRHDKTNAIQLRAIYDIGVGIAKSFINSKSEEVFLWNEHFMENGHSIRNVKR